MFFVISPIFLYSFFCHSFTGNKSKMAIAWTVFHLIIFIFTENKWGGSFGDLFPALVFAQDCQLFADWFRAKKNAPTLQLPSFCNSCFSIKFQCAWTRSCMRNDIVCLIFMLDKITFQKTRLEQFQVKNAAMLEFDTPK